MKLIPDSIDLSGYYEEQLAYNVLPASTWVDPLIEHFWKPEADRRRIYLPWAKTKADFEFLPGNTTLWAGISGHGKSNLVGQVVNGLCEQGERTAMASLEMSPVRTMARMSRQCYGGAKPVPEYLRALGRWTDDKLWLYDHVGRSDPRTMVAVIRYAVDKFGITQFVVDNLMKVVKGEDDYNGQKDFVEALAVAAADTGCHIHLVLHVKKLQDESRVPNKFDIHGAGALTNVPDNVFMVWRNKPKEDKIRVGETVEPTEADCLLSSLKVRGEDSIEARYKLWFERASLQYLESPNMLARRMELEITDADTYTESF